MAERPSVATEPPGARGRRLSALASVVEGAEVRGGDPLVLEVTEDSRTVGDAALYCAVRGARFDGHAYCPDAVAAGAQALLVDHFVDLAVPQLRVPQVRAAVGPVAAEVYGRPAEAMRDVGITGTNGKTTTAWLLRHALSAAGCDAEVIGTVRTREETRREAAILTTPPAAELQRRLAELAAEGVQAAVMEVSSHGLDQFRTDGVVFDVAVFLNLTPEHLDYHGTMEHYWASKASLFTPERARLGLVCVDDEWGRRLAAQAPIPVVTFGRCADADVAVEGVRTGLDGTSATLVGVEDHPVRIAGPVVGTVNAGNLAGAYLAARTLGIDEEAAVKGIATSAPVPGRFQLVDRGQPFLVVVDYAHTPDALAGMIDTSRRLATSGQVRVVLGCRGGRDRLKRPAMGAAAAQADRTVFTTDSPGDEDPRAIIDQMRVGALDVPRGSVVIEPDRAGAIALALGEAGPGDVVIITGRGHERVQRVANGWIPFDDHDVAARALADLGWTEQNGAGHALAGARQG
ncbi:MAG TPA: UDP-N-acetylmuramoyl-L-alanyl-D-glutamate--2,6-diaminopimelate ligase [Acidimicrobiales bacterium]|jgi:UDP-N-acetylmuramoyl-L-alanyl-D-glutamate--2,6-diaminopimelate ligase|nr:UDP-N-acetylmuramoyl-L-alanyl-D-glutamate--2,6-diaminopimelate ligase [Acidimicrobiales bacterium]